MQEGKLGYALLFSLAIHVFLFLGVLPRSISENFTKERKIWIEIEIEPSMPPREHPLPTPSRPIPSAVIKPSPPPSLQRPNDPPSAPPPPPMKPQFASPPLSWVRAHEPPGETPLDTALADNAPSEKAPTEAIEPRWEERLGVPAIVPASPSPSPATAFFSAKEEEGIRPSSSDPPSAPKDAKVVDPHAKEFGPSEDSSLSLYLALVRKKIEAHRKYPSWARRKGWEGRAVLEFRIGRDGGLKSIRVIESSGYRILDEAAKEAIEKGSPYPPLPWPQNEFLDARLPVAFRLEENPWRDMERR